MNGDPVTPLPEENVNIEVKCVICGHRWVTALSKEMPMCILCMGPVVAVKAERKLRSVK